MKKTTVFASALALSLTLTGCSTTGDLLSSVGLGSGKGQTIGADRPYRLSANHWSDVANIRSRANELSLRVGKGDLTKVQAAQLLNDYRIKLVGRNTVDDNMYTVYLRAATQSQSGQISTAQSKQLIESALKGWGQRWPNMQNRPTNPAFTNFLNEVMGVAPLR